MPLPQVTALGLDLNRGVLTVTLERPEVRNAMSLGMVAGLDATLESVRERRDVRAIVLRGAGGTFCAGGDVKDMRRALAVPKGERRARLEELSRAFGELLGRLDGAPQVVIAAVEGTAMGGGLGLVSVADVVCATESARFGLPETTLGLVPAQIAPFVVRRIGLAAAKRFALTGASFGTAEAREIGLVHHVCSDGDSLSEKVAEVLDAVRCCAPGALAATKKLLNGIAGPERRNWLDETARIFADALLGPEGQEGTRALVEKRPPKWTAT